MYWLILHILWCLKRWMKISLLLSKIAKEILGIDFDASVLENTLENINLYSTMTILWEINALFLNATLSQAMDSTIKVYNLYSCWFYCDNVLESLIGTCNIFLIQFYSIQIATISIYTSNIYSLLIVYR